MAVTISDVAHAAGVSKGAVSYALNGQPGVSEGTRERILQVAKELGWKPSLRAKGLSSAKAYALGLVVARDPSQLGTDPFFPAFIAGIETALAEHDYTLVLSVATGAGAEERCYRKLAENGRVDGFLLTDVRHDDSRIPLLQELKLPAVTLNRPDAYSPFPAVSMDDCAGITAAVEHLVGLGHTRIAHVGGGQEYIHGRSRRQAWEDALATAGLRADLFAEADFTAAGGMAATAELLRRADRPTAIVYANDLMATAGQSYAQTQGLSVPGDLSVTGYDNADFTQYLNPPLTTVSTEPMLWGRVAAQVLLNQLSNAHDGEDTVLKAPSLLVRASTGPVPAG
ncbi:LacI family DNA-binding transcriptional regulator [Arthrobacter sp. B10-11]|uniref:LacI family DNA-binding transcriptional regulator n=1 Tax=Arthrobacter sp. B10-11 TaxID=3081160 RepID=UPI002952E611|nr:LacI family DNA-binding transcriptional regulator [Arthrobacter sp. B10-11]MDV8148654.1 LacI family DNA-binding transcriptional regulator [Arthrobacter sp. B10-11]